MWSQKLVSCNRQGYNCVVMSDMPVVLTERRRLTLRMIEGIAPDSGTWRAADSLSRSGKVSSLGRYSAGDWLVLWAEFPEGRRPPAHVSIVLPTLLITCTCAATRFPCRHALARLMMEAGMPGESDAVPDWATARLEAARRVPPLASSVTDGDAQRAAVLLGMDELARRLRDLVGAGLANAGRRPWLAAAERLEDAYAPAAAAELRALAALPGSADDWPEQLLPRLGRLMLLATAFSRLDELSPGERGDVMTAVGWPPRPRDDRVRDTWLALGRRQLLDSGQRSVHTWLRGLSSGRWALLSEYRPANRLEGYCYPIGSRLYGELAFLPSAHPLAACPAAPLRLDGGLEPTARIEGLTIEAAVAESALARAANPWLSSLPMLLAGVIVDPAPAGWRLRDSSQRLLPLPRRFGHGWQLLALAGDRPLTLFGEWDGATLTPLSVYLDDWRDLSLWKALT